MASLTWGGTVSRYASSADFDSKSNTGRSNCFSSGPVISGTYLSKQRSTKEPRALADESEGATGTDVLAPEIWMRWYHFCFFMGPPLISKWMRYSLMTTELIRY